MPETTIGGDLRRRVSCVRVLRVHAARKSAYPATFKGQHAFTTYPGESNPCVARSSASRFSSRADARFAVLGQPGKPPAHAMNAAGGRDRRSVALSFTPRAELSDRAIDPDLHTHDSTDCEICSALSRRPRFAS